MARFGSEKIRGHGIPEAIEAILIGGSRMSPKVAILKPLFFIIRYVSPLLILIVMLKGLGQF